MHESGIVHRDLNPRNIMVDRNGDIKVMDFGVAKIVGVEGLTHDGQVIGTMDYMAPAVLPRELTRPAERIKAKKTPGKAAVGLGRTGSAIGGARFPIMERILEPRAN